MKYLVAALAISASLIAHAQVTQISHGANSPNVVGVKEVNLGTGAKTGKAESVADLKQQLAAEHRKAVLSDLDAHVSDATAAELQSQSVQQQAQQKVQAVRALVEQDRIELGYPEGTLYDFQKHEFVPPAPKAADKK